MNAVEIEEAVSDLAEAPFNVEAFPYAFLEAFGNKETTLKRLRSGNTNQSDVGGVLQRGNIHIKVCPEGEVAATLTALRQSPATARHKAKFILATDGKELLAENVADDLPPLACEFRDLPNHFGFFLPLAGISTVRQISENAFDIRATGRLNRLYVELSRHNPEWDTRREDLNHFFARLIFCFFAEDTGIFQQMRLFTETVETMTERDGSNTHEVLAELFRAMNTRKEDRIAAETPSWAMKFPYVNGGLFSGTTDTPRFSKIARSYLLFVGNLDWKRINPDIFGSMIQAVADDEERGALGMHYTSVPNILKVLNPLFLDDVRARLEEAGDGRTPGSARKLLNLRNRLARIRVFDPACGSGNFLVIAYKEMRQIEAIINERRNEMGNPSVIPTSNFRGIEIRTFAAEVARLALIIAEFQCDVIYGGEMFARDRVLPLDQDNWITCGNSLRLDWLSICPPTGTAVKVSGDDLYNTPPEQAEIVFENEGGETYVCGNPPYVGSAKQGADQKTDVHHVFEAHTKTWRSLDLVACWFKRASEYLVRVDGAFAFVSTKSICQGEQVPILWPLIYQVGMDIFFAHTSFKWSNLASHNAGVTVVIVGVSRRTPVQKRLFQPDAPAHAGVRLVDNINAYLVPGRRVIVDAMSRAYDDRAYMIRGNMPTDGGYLLLNDGEKHELQQQDASASRFLRKFLGAQEFIDGISRYCIWIEDDELADAQSHPEIYARIEQVRRMRQESKAASTRDWAKHAHKFRQIQGICRRSSIVVPRVTSEKRAILPAGYFDSQTIVGDRNFAMCDAPLWNLAVIVSRIHWVWISTVCVRLEMRFSYSNTLGWNTFPILSLTDQNKADLTRCAEEILLTREAHFPATIADLYDPEQMPADLRAAHERNDETLERIYIGRRFRNDTERLEKLFEMYTQMAAKTAGEAKPKPARRSRR